jgi:hypothetical protein
MNEVGENLESLYHITGLSLCAPFLFCFFPFLSLFGGGARGEKKDEREHVKRVDGIGAGFCSPSKTTSETLV